MQFKKFKEYFNIISGFLPQKTKIDMFNYVCFDECVIRASNGSEGIQIWEDTGFQGCINGNDLKDLFSKVKSPKKGEDFTVVITVNPLENQAIFHINDLEYTYKILPVSQYIFQDIPTRRRECFSQTLTEELINVLNAGTEFCLKNSLFEVFNGVFLSSSQLGLEISASDNSSIFYWKRKEEAVSRSSAFSCLLPHNFCSMIYKSKCYGGKLTCNEYMAFYTFDRKLEMFAKLPAVTVTPYSNGLHLPEPKGLLPITRIQGKEIIDYIKEVKKKAETVQEKIVEITLSDKGMLLHPAKVSGLPDYEITGTCGCSGSVSLDVQSTTICSFFSSVESIGVFLIKGVACLYGENSSTGWLIALEGASLDSSSDDEDNGEDE